MSVRRRMGIATLLVWFATVAGLLFLVWWLVLRR